MELREFIEQLKEEYKLNKSVPAIETIVFKHARESAANSKCIAVDDDTVKEWIINSDNEELPEPPKQTPVVPKARHTEPIKETLPVVKPKKEGKIEYEQIGLFDI